MGKSYQCLRYLRQHHPERVFRATAPISGTPKSALDLALECGTERVRLFYDVILCRLSLALQDKALAVRAVCQAIPQHAPRHARKQRPCDPRTQHRDSEPLGLCTADALFVLRFSSFFFSSSCFLTLEQEEDRFMVVVSSRTVTRVSSACVQQLIRYGARMLSYGSSLCASITDIETVARDISDGRLNNLHTILYAHGQLP